METKGTLSVETKENGISKRVAIDQVENGFIITIEKYGDIPNEKCGCKKPCDCKTWFNETKRYISKNNPFEKKKEESKSDFFNLINDMIIPD